MAGSTGSPLNLNLLEGGDDVVAALTSYFNQNMNLLNASDSHVKTWQPNTAYQKADIVMHPYQSKLIYALSAHTSSNSTTEDAWGTNDGSKWGSLSFTPNVIPWQANNYFQGNDIFFDGNELKKATQAGASSTLDRTVSSFVGSRVAAWTPNTQYNVGDLAYIGNLNPTDNGLGTFKSTIVRCIASHISSTQFPASTDNKWEIVNLESYTYLKNINQGNGLMGDYLRKGNVVEVSITSSTSSPIGMSTKWSTMAKEGTIPLPFIPKKGVDTLSSIGDYNNIFIRRFQTDGSILVKQAWGGPGTAASGSFFTENNVHWFTDADPVWSTAVPTF